MSGMYPDHGAEWWSLNREEQAGRIQQAAAAEGWAVTEHEAGLLADRYSAEVMDRMQADQVHEAYERGSGRTTGNEIADSADSDAGLGGGDGLRMDIGRPIWERIAELPPELQHAPAARQADDGWYARQPEHQLEAG